MEVLGLLAICNIVHRQATTSILGASLFANAVEQAQSCPEDSLLIALIPVIMERRFRNT